MRSRGVRSLMADKISGKIKWGVGTRARGTTAPSTRFGVFDLKPYCPDCTNLPRLPREGIIRAEALVWSRTHNICSLDLALKRVPPPNLSHGACITTLYSLSHVR
jgi:hypothetical protein